MSIDELERLLYDMYQMDICMPPLFGGWIEEFEKTSHRMWAINEIKNYIVKQIYPRTYATIDEFCELTQKFIDKTTRYSKMNPKNQQIFQAVRDMAIDVLDFLKAMR